MTIPFLLIQFDFKTWNPTEIFLHGNNDEETARLKQIADKIKAVAKGSNENN